MFKQRIATKEARRKIIAKNLPKPRVIRKAVKVNQPNPKSKQKPVLSIRRIARANAKKITTPVPKRRASKKRGVRSRSGRLYPVYKKGSKYAYVYHSVKARASTQGPFQMVKTNPDFDIIPLKDFTVEVAKNYDVVCIYMLIQTELLNREFNKLLRDLKGVTNIVLHLHDIHDYTFVDKTSKYNTSPLKEASVGFRNFRQYLLSGGVKHIFSHCECPEYSLLRKYCSPLLSTTRVIPFHVDTTIFRDYKQPKRYDVGFFGAASAAYRFRKRMLKILIAMGRTRKIRFKHIKTPYGIPLAKEINSCWMCIATTSNFDYLVKKYFEISASKTVVLGNMNRQGAPIWGSNYVHIDNSMKDGVIMNKILTALKDKKLLAKKASVMYDKISTDYSNTKYVEKLNNYFKEIDHQENDKKAEIIEVTEEKSKNDL